MNIKSIALIISLVLSTFPAYASSKTFISIGYGNRSCEEWTDTKNSPADREVFQQWVTGYLTGFNQYGLAVGKDVTETIDQEELFKWVDGFCYDYPTATITSVSQALVVELQIKSFENPHYGD